MPSLALCPHLTAVRLSLFEHTVFQPKFDAADFRDAFRHNSQLQETPAAGPKANQLRRERRAQLGHAHQRRVRRGGVGSSSAELQQQLQPLICYV